MTRGERQLREAIIVKCRWMNDSGLNQARRPDADDGEEVRKLRPAGFGGGDSSDARGAARDR